MLRSVPMSDAQVVAPFTTFGKGMLSNKLSLLPPEQKQRHLTARATLLIAERPAAHSDCAQQHGERAGKLGFQAGFSHQTGAAVCTNMNGNTMPQFWLQQKEHSGELELQLEAAETGDQSCTPSE